MGPLNFQAVHPAKQKHMGFESADGTAFKVCLSGCVLPSGDVEERTLPQLSYPSIPIAPLMSDDEGRLFRQVFLRPGRGDTMPWKFKWIPWFNTLPATCNKLTNTQLCWE